MPVDSEQIFDLVPLGRVWEFPSGQGALLMAEIERRFSDGRLSIYGRRPGRYDRELIRFPLDCRIDWLGDRSPRGDYCAPRAVAPWDLSAPSDKWPTHPGQALYDQIKFEDLAALQKDYASIVDELGLTDPASQVTDSLTANSSPSISITGGHNTDKKCGGADDPSIISPAIETPEKRLEKPVPIMHAIKSLADRFDATGEQAWAEIKSKAFHRQMSLEGIDDKGRLCSLEPHWVPYIVPWGTHDASPDRGSALAGGAEPQEPQHPSTSDMPKVGGFIAFDRERAIRDRRADGRDGRPLRSIPPLRMRDVAVDGTELDDLWARAEYEFRSLDWSLGNALSWIAYRDPLMICEFENRKEVAWRQFYDFPRSKLPRRAMVLSAADQSLLQALKAGTVTAIRNGTEVPSTYWFGKRSWDLEVDLRFRSDEIIKHWPAERIQADQTTGPFRPTGAPGRPTKGMHIIRAEFEQRRRANECEPSLREEATELEGWFRNNFPAAQPVSRKTIENNIRSDYRNRSADRQSPER